MMIFRPKSNFSNLDTRKKRKPLFYVQCLKLPLLSLSVQFQAQFLFDIESSSHLFGPFFAVPMLLLVFFHARRISFATCQNNSSKRDLFAKLGLKAYLMRFFSRFYFLQNMSDRPVLRFSHKKPFLQSCVRQFISIPQGYKKSK